MPLLRGGAACNACNACTCVRARCRPRARGRGGCARVPVPVQARRLQRKKRRKGGGRLYVRSVPERPRAGGGNARLRAAPVRAAAQASAHARTLDAMARWRLAMPRHTRNPGRVGNETASTCWSRGIHPAEAAACSVRGASVYLCGRVVVEAEAGVWAKELGFCGSRGPALLKEQFRIQVFSTRYFRIVRPLCC